MGLRSVITIGSAEYLLLDRSETEDSLELYDMSRRLTSLGGECDAVTREARSGGDYYWHVLTLNRLGATPRVAGQAVGVDFAHGSYIEPAELGDFIEYGLAATEFWLGPCRPLPTSGFALPTTAQVEAAAQSAEENQELIRIVRDNPEVAQATVEDDGRVTATTTTGEVLSIADSAGSSSSGGGGTKFLVGLALATTVLGAVWLLFKGRR